MTDPNLKARLSSRLARAGLLTDRTGADLWLRLRVDHNTRRSLIDQLFTEEPNAP